MALTPAFDLSLYLVTDSTQAILGDRSLVSVVKQALVGGVTIVQYRDKTSDTLDMIRMGKLLHDATKAHNVPLLINDRVDVAIAVGAEGVHLGQDDMDIKDARKILGEKSIIGATVSNQNELRRAINDGADYLGIGTVYSTPTKKDTKTLLGTAGVQALLAESSSFKMVPCVAIGGINASNVQRIIYQSSSTKAKLDGVAVVSAIVAAKNPQTAAQELKQLIMAPSPYRVTTHESVKIRDVAYMLQSVPDVVKKVGTIGPLSHNITNTVVQNFSANVTLAIGASPIMSNNPAEAADLATLGGGLLINMGTLTAESIPVYVAALQAYNRVGNPTILDPVGAGATAIRRGAVKTLMSSGFFDVIKGNEGELTTVYGTEGPQQKGVDSGPSKLTPDAKADLVKSIAGRQRNLVLMTGETDYLSDGDRTYTVRNGHKFMGRITGSGCALGSLLAAFLVVHKEDKLLAALAAVLVYGIAGENAAARESVRGPGTFVPAFMDELYAIAEKAARGEKDWCGNAKVDLVPR